MISCKSLVLFLLVLFLNLFYLGFGNLGFVVMALGVFVYLALVLKSEQKTQKRLKLQWLGILVLNLSPLLWKANSFVIGLLVLSALVILVSFIYNTVFGQKFFRNWLEVILSPLKLINPYLKSFFAPLIEPIAKPSKVNKKPNLLAPILRGLLIALPFVVILLMLLTAGDPIYAKFIQNLLRFKFDFNTEIVGRIVFSLIMMAIFFPFIFIKTVKDDKELGLPKLSDYPIEMMVLVGLVGLLLGSFLIIQFPYIFAQVNSEINLSQFGVATYSEYVRKGFIELLFASVIVYLVINLGLLTVKKIQNLNKYQKIFQLAVLAELFIFIISLIRRIGLYVTFHGWSLIRVYGGIFLIWLILMLAILLIRHFKNQNWFKTEFILAFSFIIFIGIFNAEAFILHSKHLPTVNNRVDYVYLSRLSPDGYEGWQKAYDYAYDVLVKRDLLNKDYLINREQRREVIYAGMIINNLSQNYNHLILDYGTKHNIEDYYIKIIDNNKDELAQYLSNDELVKIHQIKEKALSLNKSHIQLNTIPFFVPNYNPGEKVDFYYIYFDDRREIVVKNNFQIWKWNKANASAFYHMDKEIGFDNLLKLQNECKKIHDKISAQTPEEKTYDLDISTNSPLVD